MQPQPSRILTDDPCFRPHAVEDGHNDSATIVMAQPVGLVDDGMAVDTPEDHETMSNRSLELEAECAEELAAAAADSGVPENHGEEGLKGEMTDEAGELVASAHDKQAEVQHGKFDGLDLGRMPPPMTVPTKLPRMPPWVENELQRFIGDQAWDLDFVDKLAAPCGRMTYFYCKGIFFCRDCAVIKPPGGRPHVWHPDRAFSQAFHVIAEVSIETVPVMCNPRFPCMHCGTDMREPELLSFVHVEEIDYFKNVVLLEHPSSPTLEISKREWKDLANAVFCWGLPHGCMYKRSRAAGGDQGDFHLLPLIEDWKYQYLQRDAHQTASSSRQ